MNDESAAPTAGLKHSVVDVAVVVSESDRALAFYRDALGLDHFADTPLGDGGQVHRLKFGQTVLKVIQHTPGREGNPMISPMSELGFRYITLFVDNLDEIAERCTSQGFDVVVAPSERRPGFKVAMINDPDGNRWELIETTAE